MIVVDSSVWIQWIRGYDTPETRKFNAQDPLDVIIADIVLLELLQGARDDRQAEKIQRTLQKFQLEEIMNTGIAVEAGGFFRRLRGFGITIRKTSDLIIGTFCIQHSHALLHADRDFVPMQQHLGLRCL